MASKAKRQTIPLTRAQLETQQGTELLALCQTITEDGSIAQREVEELKGWLERNRDSDLPSVPFLTATIEKIIADGRVDEGERRDLLRALERVLPAAERTKAVEARSEVEQLATVSNPRLLFAPFRVGEVFDFMVAGIAYEGRAVVASRVAPDDLAYLVRDRANKHSRNAIEVRLADGLMVGFVPEHVARELAPRLDEGCKYHAWVKKVLGGARMPVPVVIGEILRTDVGIPIALVEGQLPGSAKGLLSAKYVEAALEADADLAPTALTAFSDLLIADLRALPGRKLDAVEVETLLNEFKELKVGLRAFVDERPLIAEPGAAIIAAADRAVAETIGNLRPGLEGARGQAPQEVDRLLWLADEVVRELPSAAGPPPQSETAKSSPRPTGSTIGPWPVLAGLLLLALAVAAVLVLVRK